MSNTGTQEQTTTELRLEILWTVLWSDEFGPGKKASAIEETLIRLVDGTVDLEPQQVTALVALLAHYDAQSSTKAQYESSGNY